ncbi:putative disease resistance protein RGA4 [Gossypium hirsutum]|uniref:Disease resistance protein RGA4 n=1 Tax=Gossypium hirsutum TaxID=3635 RepID=A0ABM2Z2G6_GOSHI|nr:putative disease resistance protein RGA4 [Gossypium hirsutum]
MFVVNKDGSNGGADLSELSGLNNLRGELRIRNLGFVQNAEEKFKAANLKEKQHLRYLILEWGLYSNDDDKSLEDLQPHPNLKELRIVGWSGDAKFPSWLSLLTNLVEIRIWWGNFKHLPSFAQLPCLKHLYIYDCAELEYMDDNSPKESQGNTEPFFSSLKVPFLSHCPNMQSWWRTTEAIGDDSNEDSTTVTGTSAMIFPCLSYLEIENCPLTSMPLYPSLDQKLKLVNTSSRPLKQTMKMNMNAKTPSSSTSSLPLSKLRYFHVYNIEGLDTHTLDGCLQHLINLQGLSLINFPNLTSLPDEMRCLTNLQRLNIYRVPQLEERCEKEIGADWYKIAHIPSVTHWPGYLF